MSWNTEDEDRRAAGTAAADAVAMSPGQWRTTHAVGVQALDGSRRYELTYEHLASGHTRFTITGCDAQGVVVADLQAEVPRDDLPLIVNLLSGFTEPPPTQTETPGPRPGPAPALPGHRTLPAERTGELWTERDRDTVRALHTEGVDVVEIACRLGRTENSIRWKMWELRIGPRPGGDATGRRPDPAATPAVVKPKAYTVEDLRKTHPNSHRRWTPGEDARLLERAGQGAGVVELMEEFGRNEKAITARLERLADDPPSPEPPF